MHFNLKQLYREEPLTQTNYEAFRAGWNAARSVWNAGPRAKHGGSYLPGEFSERAQAGANAYSGEADQAAYRSGAEKAEIYMEGNGHIPTCE